MGKRASQRAFEAQKKLISGAILRLHCTDLKIRNKTKRFLVLATSLDKKFISKLYFDSTCPPIPYQLQFGPNGYLDKISYLDCSEIYEDDYNRIVNQLANKLQAYIGQMDMADLKIVKDQIKIASTIPESIKKKYGIVDIVNQ